MEGAGMKKGEAMEWPDPQPPPTHPPTPTRSADKHHYHPLPTASFLVCPHRSVSRKRGGWG